MKELKRKLNHRSLGLIIGLLFPLLSLLILWQVKFENRTFGNYLHFLSLSSKLRDNILILSMVPNLIVFYFVSFRWNWEKFSATFVSVTVVFAVIITLLMLVF